MKKPPTKIRSQPRAVPKTLKIKAPKKTPAKPAAQSAKPPAQIEHPPEIAEGLAKPVIAPLTKAARSAIEEKLFATEEQLYTVISEIVANFDGTPDQFRALPIYAILKQSADFLRVPDPAERARRADAETAPNTAKVDISELRGARGVIDSGGHQDVTEPMSPGS